MNVTTETWLHDLYGATTDADLWLTVCWRNRQGRIGWEHTPTSVLDGAAAFIDGLSEWTCTWVGCAPLADRPDRGRGGAADTGALVGVWADIDVAGPGHKHPDDADLPLPVDIDQALDVLADLLLPPTKVLHTGGGLQAWWLFHEPWLFDGDADRAQAGALAGAWGDTVVEVGRRRGLHVDNVGDLARILRPAGTWNRKPDREPVAVRTLVADGPRHYVADLEDVLLPAPAPATRPAPAGGRGLTGDGPADVFARNITWSELLEPHGWRRFTHTNGAPALGSHCPKCGARVELWTHNGVSVNHRGQPLHVSATACHALYVFSDNPTVRPLPTRRGLTPFTTWALLEHDGDLSAAARAILRAARQVSANV